MFKNEDVARGYLAALIDGEGTVSKPDVTRQVSIINTDTSLLDAARAALALLGIAFREYKRQPGGMGRKEIVVLVVSTRAALERLAAVVELHCASKRDRLDALLVSYTRYGQRPDAVEFAEVYSRLGQRGAAEHYGVSQGTIHNWRRFFKVGARPVGRPRGSTWSAEERAKREASRSRR